MANKSVASILVDMMVSSANAKQGVLTALEDMRKIVNEKGEVIVPINISKENITKSLESALGEVKGYVDKLNKEIAYGTSDKTIKKTTDYLQKFYDTVYGKGNDISSKSKDMFKGTMESFARYGKSWFPDTKNEFHQMFKDLSDEYDRLFSKNGKGIKGILPIDKELDSYKEAQKSIETLISNAKNVELFDNAKLQESERQIKTLTETISQLRKDIELVNKDLAIANEANKRLQTENAKLVSTSQKAKKDVVETKAETKTTNTSKGVLTTGETTGVKGVVGTTKPTDNTEVGNIQAIQTAVENLNVAIKAKTESIVKEELQMRSSADKEIKSIKAIENAINMLQDLLSNLSKKDGMSIDQGWLQSFTQLTTSIEKLSNTKAGKSFDTKMENIAEGINTLKTAMKDFSVGEDANTFLNEINALTERSEELANLASVLKSGKKAIEETKSATSKTSSGSKSKEESFDFGLDKRVLENLSKAENAYKRYYKIRKEYDKLDKRSQTQYRDNYANRLQEQMAEYKGIIEEFGQLHQDGALSKMTASLLSDDTLKRIDKVSEGFRQITEDYGNLVSGNVTKDQTTATKSLDSLIEKFDPEIVKGFDTEIQSLRNSIEGIGSTKSLKDFNSELDVFKGKLTEAKQVADTLAADEKLGKIYAPLAGYKFDSADVMTNLKNVQTALKEAYGNAISGFKLDEKSGTLTATLKENNNEVTRLKLSIDSLGNVRGFNTVITKANDLKKVLGEIGSGLKTYVKYFVTPTHLIGYFRQGINTLKEFDSSLTSISYTMDISQNQLNNLGKSARNMAEELHSSIKDATSVAQIYSNMQTSAEEIMETAKPTLVLSNLTGSDASTAADQIQGVIQQFELGAKDAEHIIDVYDKISANIPVDYAKGINSISEAVKSTGQAAREAGLSFEQLGAIIGNTIATTRQDGSRVGNALRTMMTRLSKASKLSGADEVDNETLSNASKALHDIGIEVYKADGEYRKFDVILGELSEKWDDLTDAQRANISFQIAATRQTSMLQAILKNYGKSMELAEEATNAEGNAMANQEKYADSFKGRMQELSTTIESSWLNIADSDSAKAVLTLLEGIAKAIEFITDKAGGLGTIGMALGTYLSAKNVGRVKMYALNY